MRSPHLIKHFCLRFFFSFIKEKKIPLSHPPRRHAVVVTLSDRPADGASLPKEEEGEEQEQEEEEEEKAAPGEANGEKKKKAGIQHEKRQWYYGGK